MERPIRGIDLRQPPRPVRANPQFPVADPDSPWLRVMTAWGKRRVLENRANPGGEDRRANIARRLINAKIGPGEAPSLVPCVAGSGNYPAAQRPKYLSSVHVGLRSSIKYRETSPLPKVPGDILGGSRIS